MTLDICHSSCNLNNDRSVGNVLTRLRNGPHITLHLYLSRRRQWKHDDVLFVFPALPPQGKQTEQDRTASDQPGDPKTFKSLITSIAYMIVAVGNDPLKYMYIMFSWHSAIRNLIKSQAMKAELLVYKSG